jgi:hypothetical protein
MLYLVSVLDVEMAVRTEHSNVSSWHDLLGESFFRFPAHALYSSEFIASAIHQGCSPSQVSRIARSLASTSPNAIPIPSEAEA